MMRNSKRVLAWLCIAALALTGCGGQMSEAELGELNSEISTQIVSEIRHEIPAPEPVTVLQHIGGLYRLETTLPLTDVVTFYRTAYTQRGATERVAETTITNTSATLVFDGDTSGKVVQVRLAPNNTNTAITVELK